MLFAFSVAPSASDESGSVSAAVADAVQIVRDSGLPYELKADLRPGYSGQLRSKVDRVREHLEDNQSDEV